MKSIQQHQKVKKLSTITSSLLSIHGHRYFRRLFIIILMFHMILLVLPWMDLRIIAPQNIREIFNLISQLWPFPNVKVFSADGLYIRQLLMKSLEILVILLYGVDLLPKIFLWRLSLIWRMINIFIVTLMVVQFPATLIEFDLVGLNSDQVKLRVFSISLSFVLLCENLSIREQKTLRLQKIKNIIKSRSSQHNQITTNHQEYSWCEIIKHDRQGDCWIVINGFVYDVTLFVPKHPGGSMIYDGAGGDCTSLWFSYHPTEITQQAPPEKYLIGKVRDYVSFYQYDGKFYTEIKKAVEQKIPKKNWQNHNELFIKAAILIPGYFITFYYYIIYCNVYSAIIFGFVLAQVDVNIMHDGNHSAFSSNKTLSLIAGYVLDLTFSTSVVYRRSHNFGHHGCVNHYELDRSFDTTYPIMRLHPLQPRLPMHKYQHIYIWIIYGLTNFGDVIGTFDEMRWMSNFPTRRGYISDTQLFLQIIVKITWISLTMILPSYIHGWFEVFPNWFLYMMSHSYGYTLFFAVNHWTVESGIVDNSNINQQNWGALQVLNSTNFNTNSKLWSHLSGGLNYQIEHHLFPQISHTRLPEVKKIVEEISKKYNIRYFEFPSFFKALQSHYKLLRILGQQDDLKGQF